jgi:hypothetical protein
MTRRKALTIMVSVAGLSSLVFALLWLSKPAPALSFASYAYKPGCHCGKPVAAAKPATTTTKKPTTTTAKTTSTTVKKATTTATSGTKAATTSTGQAAAKSTTTKSTTGKTSTKTKSTKHSTTTAGAGSDGQSGSDQSGTLALGAAVASFPGGGDGGSSGGSGGGSGSLDTTGLAGADPVAAAVSGPPRYYLSPVAIVFLLVYGVSFALYRTKRLRVATHRKIWNLLLMATFLLCGILGLVLTWGITRTPRLMLPTWLLVWHVETGIAMCFISVFHIGWHLRYYLAIVKGKRRVARAEKVPAVEQGAGRERVRRPRVAPPSLVRTEADRMLAFEQRQTGRTGGAGVAQARNTRRAPASSEAERWVEEVRGRVVPAS